MTQALRALVESRQLLLFVGSLAILKIMCVLESSIKRYFVFNCVLFILGYIFFLP